MLPLYMIYTAGEGRMVPSAPKLYTEGACIIFKMLYLIGPDGRVNRRFIDFQKMVWMTTVHIIHIHAVFLEICIPSVYKVCRIYQVLSQRAS